MAVVGTAFGGDGSLLCGGINALAILSSRQRRSRGWPRGAGIFDNSVEVALSYIRRIDDAIVPLERQVRDAVPK